MSLGLSMVSSAFVLVPRVLIDHHGDAMSASTSAGVRTVTTGAARA